MAGGSATSRGGTLTTVLCRGLILLETLLAAVVVGTANTPMFSDLTFSVEPSDVVVMADESALLNCSARHHTATPSIQWVRNEDDVIEDDGDPRRYKLGNGSLFFTKVIHTPSYRPDEGIYQCHATVTALGTIVSRKARLQVAYLAKEFTEEPQSLQLHLGDTAMFACFIEGWPRPAVRWYKGDLQLAGGEDDVHYVLHPDGVLEIRRVTFADFGRYKCVVESIEKRTSKFATFSQNPDASTYKGVNPAFVMRPAPRQVVVGETVILYCGAHGRDRAGNQPSISWLKEGVTIDMADLDSRYSLVGQGSLRVEEVREEDTGSYTCRATNQEDSEDAVASLTVLAPPLFKKKPLNLAAHVTADVQFECEVTGEPRPIVTWRKNGDLVVPSDYFQILENNNLRILGLVPSDAGLYQCLAENAVGNLQASAQLVVLESDSPHAITPPTAPPPEASQNPDHPRRHHNTHNTRHHAGSAAVSTSDLPSAPTGLVAAIVSKRFVTLSWQMPAHTGSSEIVVYSVFWREEGSNRERVQNTTTLEANIQHLKPATKYEFRVVGYNRVGASETPAQTTVQTQTEVSVPEAPTRLEAEAISPTAVYLQWSPPEGETGHIQQYKVYYYPVGADLETAVDVRERRYELQGLRKFTEYNFRVVAYNSNGPGMSTEEVTARTYSDVPDEPPVNVTLETDSSTSILVRWEPPPEESQNGVITGYKIRFRRKSMRRSDTVTTDGNRRSFALTGLARGKEYQVKVWAFNVNGTSPTTSWIVGETFLNDLDETNVPGRPTSLRVRPLNNKIVVSWTPPAEQDVMVRGYILGYGKNIPDVYKQVLDAKTRYHTIKNPEPSSQYVISLRAYNSVGEGRPIYETVNSREETTQEPMTPIMPPVGLKAIVLSSTTIVITWSDMTLGSNQKITDNRYYTIRYLPRDARKAKQVNSTDLNVHIDDLKPNTEYEFSVKVIKSRRQSAWSLSVFNKTFEAAPGSAPRDLTPVAVEGKPTWITLNWQPPRQPNGQIIGYLVFYTTDATQEDRDWVVEGVMGDRLSTTIRALTPETTYYFKVQARNSKGYGPMSPTVIFRTPRADGTGGGKIETPNDYGKPNYGLPDTRSEHPRGNRGSATSANSLPPMVLWIVIAAVAGISIIAIVAVTVIVCKRRNDGDRRRKGGYMAPNKKSGPTGVKGGPKDVKPPDLWIHDMELKSLEKGGSNGDATTMTVTPTPRNAQDKMGDSVAGMGMDHRRNSFIREPNLYEPDEDRYRRPLRAKPIMIPVDQRPPPREPIAMAIPNGHLLGQAPSPGPPPDLGPPRPLYPRTQYSNHQTGHSPMYTSTPRVNICDTSQPPSGLLSGRPPRPGLTHLTSLRPQQQNPTSPYKKPAPPISNATTPITPRSPLPVVTPKAPDVTIRSDRSHNDSDLPKSYSAEELNAEMANLEGLMKDLNAITQQEFEC